jgi:hypothetical protein
MQLPTVDSVIDFLFKSLDENMKFTYDDIIRDPPRSSQELALTPSERTMIRENLPREFLYLFEPIWGNPSPISPMWLSIYVESVASHITHYLLVKRYVKNKTKTSAFDYDTVTLHANTQPTQKIHDQAS